MLGAVPLSLAVAMQADHVSCAARALVVLLGHDDRITQSPSCLANTTVLPSASGPVRVPMPACPIFRESSAEVDVPGCTSMSSASSPGLGEGPGPSSQLQMMSTDAGRCSDKDLPTRR
eukprot:4792491-Prymnesium_polylepis.2